MNTRRLLSLPVVSAALAAGFTTWMLWAARMEPGFRHPVAETWRQEKRIVDLHMHIEATPERFGKVLDMGVLDDNFSGFRHISNLLERYAPVQCRAEPLHPAASLPAMLC